LWEEIIVSYVDRIEEFVVDEKRRGTAHEICDYLIEKKEKFDCSENRRITSVSSQLNRKCKEKDGFLDRVLNEHGVYEYFAKVK
jgi:hypothetical protein